MNDVCAEMRQALEAAPHLSTERQRSGAAYMLPKGSELGRCGAGGE